MKSECNVSLMTSLLRKNVSTRDIYFFIKNQASLRKVFKDLDRPLSKAAMRAKLNDACAFVVRQRRCVTRLKQDLLKALDHKRFKFRKVVKSIREKLNIERASILAKNASKVEHYMKLQLEMESHKSEKSFNVPSSIREFSSLKAFKKSDKPVLKDNLPMVYDDNIKLSDAEVSSSL